MAAGQPQACLVLVYCVIPGSLSFLQIRGECSSIPADFVIPSDLVIVSDFVISSDFVIPRLRHPPPLALVRTLPAPATLSFSEICQDFP